jgi:hypothetical protein
LNGFFGKTKAMENGRLREIRWRDVDWMHLAQDTDQWWSFVNTVMNLRFPYEAGEFLD